MNNYVTDIKNEIWESCERKAYISAAIVRSRPEKEETNGGAAGLSNIIFSADVRSQKSRAKKKEKKKGEQHNME